MLDIPRTLLDILGKQCVLQQRDDQQAAKVRQRRLDLMLRVQLRGKRYRRSTTDSAQIAEAPGSHAHTHLHERLLSKGKDSGGQKRQDLQRVKSEDPVPQQQNL